jgi:hypothetical protein
MTSVYYYPQIYYQWQSWSHFEILLPNVLYVTLHVVNNEAWWWGGGGVAFNYIICVCVPTN